MKYNIGLGYKIGSFYYTTSLNRYNKRMHFMYDPIYPVIDPNNKNIGINSAIMKWAAMGSETEQQEIQGEGKDTSILCNYTDATQSSNENKVNNRFVAYPLSSN